MVASFLDLLCPFERQMAALVVQMQLFDPHLGCAGSLVAEKRSGWFALVKGRLLFQSLLGQGDPLILLPSFFSEKSINEQEH